MWHADESMDGHLSSMLIRLLFIILLSSPLHLLGWKVLILSDEACHQVKRKSGVWILVPGHGETTLERVLIDLIEMSNVLNR